MPGYVYTTAEKRFCILSFLLSLMMMQKMSIASIRESYCNTLPISSQTKAGSSGFISIVPPAKLFNPPYCPFYLVFCCWSLFSSCQGITVLWNSNNSFRLLCTAGNCQCVSKKTYSPYCLASGEIWNVCWRRACCRDDGKERSDKIERQRFCLLTQSTQYRCRDTD